MPSIRFQHPTPRLPDHPLPYTNIQLWDCASRAADVCQNVRVAGVIILILRLRNRTARVPAAFKGSLAVAMHADAPIRGPRHTQTARTRAFRLRFLF
jgi:hypothetical protein